jgi:hypothetical protein
LKRDAIMKFSSLLNLNLKLVLGVNSDWIDSPFFKCQTVMTLGVFSRIILVWKRQYILFVMV